MSQFKSFSDLPGKNPSKPKKEKTEFQRLKDNKRDVIPGILERRGVKFQTEHRGQLLINNGNESIRYWPGAGRWEVLKVGGTFGYGIQSLLEHLGVE